MKAEVCLAACALACAAQVLAHPATGPYQSPGAHTHVGPSNVLVIYNSAWGDSDTNGVNDSFEVAEYYAQRRGVPTNNLLGVSVSSYIDSTTWRVEYSYFYSNILAPTVDKLRSTNSFTGQPFYSNIYYICPVYGVPFEVNTHFSTNENPIVPGVNNHRRSLDAFLMNPFLMYTNGIYSSGPGTAPFLGAEYGNKWGDWSYEIGLSNIYGLDEWHKYYDKADDPATAKHFKKLRDAGTPNMLGTSYWYFLVTRLDGPNKTTAMGLVDKALYAERYLRNWAGYPDTGYYGRVYTDDDVDVQSGSPTPWLFRRALGGDVKNWFRGDSVSNAYDSVFDTNVSYALLPWDWVEDSHSDEIAQNSSAIPRIRNIRINAINGFTACVYYAESTGQEYSTNSFYYYVAGTILRGFEGKTFSGSGGGTAVIETVGTNGNGLAWGDVVLSSTNGLAVGDELYYDYQESFSFPLKDVMWYNAYYWHRNYPDGFQWLPGSVGFHNESSTCFEFRGSASTPFAYGALLRGLTAVGGPVREPFSVGIPFARKFFRAFCQGFDFAESCYQATPCAIAWMNTFIGDPLYNPFLPLYADEERTDADAPAFTVATSSQKHTIKVTLKSDTTDRFHEIAQFRLYYGPDSNNWANTNSYVEWPNPSSTSWDPDRRYEYLREKTWTVPLVTTTYFQVGARDSYGNETVDIVRELVIPEPVAGVLALAAVMCMLSRKVAHSSKCGVKRHSVTPQRACQTDTQYRR